MIRLIRRVTRYLTDNNIIINTSTIRHLPYMLIVVSTFAVHISAQWYLRVVSFTICCNGKIKLENMLHITLHVTYNTFMTLRQFTYL